MNKKTRFIFDALVIVALAGMYALYFFRDQEKLVYVDSAKLLNGYQAMVDARKDYQRKASSWKANVDTLTSEVQDAIKKYERDLAGISARERALSEELLKSKQRQLMDYQRAMQEKAQQEDQKMSQDVITQANSFLERYGK